jgi:AcrR family transcriptional regulator
MERPVKMSKGALRALATRRKILEAARACFIEESYGSTTIKDIAARAGVAPQTVYFVFRNKVSILSAVLDLTIAGDEEPVAVKDRPWVRELASISEADEAVALLSLHGGAIVARTAPLFRVIQSASAEPEVEALLKENKRQRAETLDLFARILEDAGVITGDAQHGYFADVLYAVLSEESYALLVDERGWTASEWQAWVARVLLQALQTLRLETPA